MQRAPAVQVNISSDDSSSSDEERNPSNDINEPEEEDLTDLSDEEWLFRKAKSYQEYMKLLPIPVDRDNVIPYMTWVGLGRSLKMIYGQPLHYLTNLQLKKWDKERLGAEDERVELTILIHPVKAETTIWLMEEVHRRITSPDALAKYWKENPTYHEHIDDIHPKLNL